MSKENQERKENCKIPFNPKDLECMLNDEFYLKVFGKDQLEEQYIRMFKGNPNIALLEGVLGRIIYREPTQCSVHWLGNLRLAYLANGTSLTDYKPEKTSNFIFTLKNIESADGKPPVLRGQAMRYDIFSNNTAKPFEDDVILYFTETPTFIELEVVEERP
ncbi:MAG: hypothetical protein V1743_04945 [Nanoarchaeota archaeon]